MFFVIFGTRQIFKFNYFRLVFTLTTPNVRTI